MKINYVKKTILAPLLISCGVAVSLSLQGPLAAILFAFGLICVCYLEANLFTGKVGYLWRNEKLKLLDILIINLVFGWLIGVFIGIANPSLVVEAKNRIVLWTFNFSFFIKSILCGIVMYLAVELYKRKTTLGILLGIPLFILCGFQHCIANIIVLGVAKTFSPTIFLCIIGNTVGSILTDLLVTNKKE